MKKEIIIILFILIFIITLNHITQNYTKVSVSLLNEKLEEIKEEIIKEKDEAKNIERKLQDLCSLWEEREQKLAYYIEHDELEKVESKINLIKGNIENKAYEETIADIEEAVFILNHIEEKYKFIIKNVF